jgi:saccharopine dehydrogenase-like NADP-dependent oxidoreductase
VHVVIVGCGRTGARVAAELARTGTIDLSLVDSVPGRATAVASALPIPDSTSISTTASTTASRTASRTASTSRSIGVPASALASASVDVRAPGSTFRDADAVVLCVPRADHGPVAEAALLAGASLVSTNDDVDEVRTLLDLGPAAAARGLSVVVGAGFSPGLSCLLARHAANGFDEVDEVHICRAGTGGPACARQHHAALSGNAIDWRGGEWLTRRGRSGRQLAHFPEPVGPRDCYRASLPDALLLRRAFPTASRLTARLAATRRDRLTAMLPMLRRPHPDGGPGGARVEVWGRRGPSREVTIYGAVGKPADIAGTVAAIATRRLLEGSMPTGAVGLSELSDPVPYLTALDEQGIVAATFEGAS